VFALKKQHMNESVSSLANASRSSQQNLSGGVTLQTPEGVLGYFAVFKFAA